MSRNPHDSADRAAYRQYVMDRIESGQSPSFRPLLGEGGKWHDMRPTQDVNGREFATDKPGVYSDLAEKGGYTELQWQASHSAHDAKGTNYLAIEDATTNMSDGAKYEKHEQFEKRTVEIEGLAVTESYARQLESGGFLKPGTVDGAPQCLGWTADRGIVGMDGKPVSQPQPSKLASEVGGPAPTADRPQPQPSKMAGEVGAKSGDAPAAPSKEPEPTIH